MNIGPSRHTAIFFSAFEPKQKSTPRGAFFVAYGLAAATVIVASATVVITGITATATAEENEDKDDNPSAVVTTEITHYKKPPFSVFITYYAENG